MKQKHYTIRDFKRNFPNDDACLEWLKNAKYPDGIFCEKCQKITKHYRITKRPAYACEICGNHVYPMVGTILEKSATPLSIWFHAMYLMANTRCGISARQLQRETGVTYKTAWRMFSKIRSMLDDNLILEGSSVEVDETYIGGKRHGKRGRGAAGKSIALGAVERGGNIIAKKVSDVKARTLLPFIRAKVLPRSVVYTDELPSYNKLSQHGYVHRRVHHAAKIYVSGDAHTNSIEGFWSLVKRGINGVYHAVSDKYLQGYLNEYSFRYNRRNSEAAMFGAFLARLVASD